MRLDGTPRDRAGIECDASWDFGAPARQRLRNCLVRLCEMPSTTLLRIFRRFQSPGGDEGYRAAFEKLEEEASHLRRGYDGYRTAFQTLQQEATQLRQGFDGYRAAFEALSAEVSQVRDERDRVLKTLHKVSRQRRSLPSGLDGRQLCFLHIGKTAGTSVQHALFDALWDAAIFHESLPGFDRVTPAELALNDLVIGHFMYQHVSKMRSARFLMTFLRDPIDRVISNYHFLRTRSPLSRYSEAALQAARSLSFKDFLLCDDRNVRMITANFQTKALAHDIRPDVLDETMTSALLENAERNLGTFDFIGICEYFDDSVRVLSEMLGVELSAKKLNVNQIGPSLRQPPKSWTSRDRSTGWTSNYTTRPGRALSAFI